MTAVSSPSGRSVVFISKATPGDDEFVLWLAPRLEAAGYTVFSDIKSLDAGDRWRKEITNVLQNGAVKMLLCCRDSTLARENVQEEIGMAIDLCKELADPKFLIPLRLEPYKKVLGIGELQYVNFVPGWAEGVDSLLGNLRRMKVPRDPSKIAINPNWEIYRRRGAVVLKDEPERLTSNWLRVAEWPDEIHYFEPTGAIDQIALYSACAKSTIPIEPHRHGFFSFGTVAEINAQMSSVGVFRVLKSINLQKFLEEGCPELGHEKQTASNMVMSMFRQGWNRLCANRGLMEYKYSKAVGFHASKAQAAIGQKFSWGRQGDKRSSMLRNIAKGVVWQFGVSALPGTWPFPHFKIKSRVLFAAIAGEEAGDPFDDAKKQHRLRRTVCKGWRNKQWHGRLMAFLEMLSGDSSFIRVPLSESEVVRLDASTMLFTSPVSTVLPDKLSDDEEEFDPTTLGRPDAPEEPQ